MTLHHDCPDQMRCTICSPVACATFPAPSGEPRRPTKFRDLVAEAMPPGEIVVVAHARDVGRQVPPHRPGAEVYPVAPGGEPEAEREEIRVAYSCGMIDGYRLGRGASICLTGGEVEEAARRYIGRLPTPERPEVVELASDRSRSSPTPEVLTQQELTAALTREQAARAEAEKDERSGGHGYAVATATFSLRAENTRLADALTALREAVRAIDDYELDVLREIIPIIQHVDRHGDGNRDPILESLAGKLDRLRATPTGGSEP